MTLEPFLQDGGTLIVHLPENGHCCDDAIVRRNISLITCCPDLIPALDARCSREVRMEPACPDLRVSHVVKEGCHFYVLVNEGETAIEGNIQTAARGNVEIWDPWAGTCETAVPASAGRLSTAVFLERRQSLILCINEEQNAAPEPYLSGQEAPQDMGCLQQPQSLQTQDCGLQDCVSQDCSLHPLTLTWQITSAVQSPSVEEAGLSKFPHSAPVLPFPDGISGDALTSWTQWPGMVDFSGTIVYETWFPLEITGQDKKWILDLGEVQEAVHLQVNGKDAGFRLWEPFRFDITPHVISGANHIRLEVANTLANGMSGAKLPSGLLGPVKLLSFSEA